MDSGVDSAFESSDDGVLDSFQFAPVGYSTVVNAVLNSLDLLAGKEELASCPDDMPGMKWLRRPLKYERSLRFFHPRDFDPCFYLDLVILSDCPEVAGIFRAGGMLGMDVVSRRRVRSDGIEVGL